MLDMLDMVTPYYLTLLGSPWSMLRPGYGLAPEEPQMEDMAGRQGAWLIHQLHIDACQLHARPFLLLPSSTARVASSATGSWWGEVFLGREEAATVILTLKCFKSETIREWTPRRILHYGSFC